MAVGVEHQAPHLGLEATQCVQCERYVAMGLQSFVHAAHAGAAPAGKNQTVMSLV